MSMLRDLFIDSFRGDWLDKIMGVIFWFILVAVIICALFLVDSSFASTKRERVRVIDKEFVEAHTTFISQTVGKTTVMTPMYHPDSWYITVSNNGYFSECQVDNLTFSKVSLGQIAYAFVGSGLISSQEYCDRFELVAGD